MITVEMMEKAKDDMSIKEMIINDVTPMVIQLANGFKRKDVPLEDRIQIGYLGVLKAINTYDKTKGTIPFTHIYNSTKWEIYNSLIIKSTYKQQMFYNASIEEVIAPDLTLGDMIGSEDNNLYKYEKQELANDLWKHVLKARVPEKSREYTYEFYKLGIPQMEIAKREKISRQMVSKRIKDTVRQLRKELDLNLYKDLM